MFDKCVWFKKKKKEKKETFREKNDKISRTLSEVKKNIYIYRNTALLVSLRSEVQMF